MNIFLIGFMGCGKSSLGKKISKQLNIKFIDADVAIENQEKLSIQDIFKQKGETAFRNIEFNWLDDLSEKYSVIALGGGMACNSNNLLQIHKKGISIYLSLSVNVLTDRLFNSKTIRPLIQNFKNDKEELHKKVESLLSGRVHFYNQCDIIFEASNMTANKMKLLLEMINKQIMLKNASSHH